MIVPLSLTGIVSLSKQKYPFLFLVTYQQLIGDNFRVKDLSEIGHDIGKLAALPDGKPIFLAEVGCPSSEYVNSSMDKQSQFISEVFKAWDKAHKRIAYLNFIWLHDISNPEVISFTKYYRLPSKEFAEYLGTLGLRSHDGKAKPAFKMLRNEAKLRGW